MRSFTIYLALLLCLFVSKLSAQQTFESKAKAIADKIEKVTKDEKEALKIEVEEVNVQLEKGKITTEQANEKKRNLAQARATIIENKIAVFQQELNDLVQAKVDGKIEEPISTKRYGTSIVIGKSNDSITNGTEINITSMKVYRNQKDKEEQQQKRTTSQFVFAAGVNNLITDGKIENSDFRYWGSHFYEWGLTYNTRLLDKNNLLHFKYGLSVMYNNLRPTDNRSFVVEGNQTALETNAINLKDSRFRNVYLVAPLHFELDFSKSKIKDGKQLFRSHESVRIGFGGYAGIRVKSKQILKYEDDNHKITEKTKGDFNVNNFIYGLSAYVGHRATSLYLKYDLNPIFKDNTIKQNNVSLGIRFDFN